MSTSSTDLASFNNFIKVNLECNGIYMDAKALPGQINKQQKWKSTQFKKASC